MTSTLASVPDGSILVDAYDPFTDAELDRLAVATYEGQPIVGAWMYHERATPERLAAYLARGWGVMFVGIARSDSMAKPSAALGLRDGHFAVRNLGRVGALPGVTCSLDCEEITAPLLADDVATYSNTWDMVVERAAQGCWYEGWGIEMTAEQLFHRLRTKRYWASSPKSLQPSGRPFACVQEKENITLAGVRLDVDRVSIAGGDLRWMISADAVA